MTLNIMLGKGYLFEMVLDRDVINDRIFAQLKEIKSIKQQIEDDKDSETLTNLWTNYLEDMKNVCQAILTADGIEEIIERCAIRHLLYLKEIYIEMIEKLKQDKLKKEMIIRFNKRKEELERIQKVYIILE